MALLLSKSISGLLFIPLPPHFCWSTFVMTLELSLKTPSFTICIFASTLVESRKKLLLLSLLFIVILLKELWSQTCLHFILASSLVYWVGSASYGASVSLGSIACKIEWTIPPPASAWTAECVCRETHKGTGQSDFMSDLSCPSVSSQQVHFPVTKICSSVFWNGSSTLSFAGQFLLFTGDLASCFNGKRKVPIGELCLTSAQFPTMAACVHRPCLSCWHEWPGPWVATPPGLWLGLFLLHLKALLLQFLLSSASFTSSLWIISINVKISSRVI